MIKKNETIYLMDSFILFISISLFLVICAFSLCITFVTDYHLIDKNIPQYKKKTLKHNNKTKERNTYHRTAKKQLE